VYGIIFEVKNWTPSLVISREVTNFGLADRRAIVARAPIDRDYGVPSSRHVSLLSPNDLFRLHRHLGIVPTTAHIIGLSDFLFQNLPYTTEFPLDVPARPVNVIDPGDRPDSSLFTIGASETLREERLATKALVRQYYGLCEEDDLGQDYDYYTDVWVARVSSPMVDAFRRLLNENVSLLPEQIHFDQAVIGETEKKY
jgi:hypothetical protein